MAWMKLSGRILDLLYPPRCAFCHRIIESGERLLCDKCEATLPFTGGNEQIQSFSHIEKCVSPLFYEGSVRDSLLRYKFDSVTAYSEIYAEFLAKSIDENALFCDIITWAPLSRKRLRDRGYDQAELIAWALSKRMNISCEALLEKWRDTKPQSGIKDAKERRANAEGAYRIKSGTSCEGKTILLVDDIVTTGSTLTECGKILREAGAKRIYAATVARSRKN